MPAHDSQRQAEIAQAMMSPQFYPHAVTEPVQKCETHISKVFLTGNYVYKIKKPLDLGFLNFSSLAKRHLYCHQEIMLNRRLSNDIYLGVVPISYQQGKYCIAFSDHIVEYAVKMRQLPDGRSMRTLLRSHKIKATHLKKLARRLCSFYGNAAVPKKLTPQQSWQSIWFNCDENFRQTRIFINDVLDAAQYETIKESSMSFLGQQRNLFLRRAATGNVRDCHGDLRSEHIYFLDDIQIIDCVEFNERLIFGDVGMDLGFLAMDLDKEGRPDLAIELVHQYVDCSNDCGVYAVIDFYKCYRAFVRTKVNCLRQQEVAMTSAKGRRLRNEALAYMALAHGYTKLFSQPMLWMLCGLPASGKSKKALAIRNIYDGVLLRSDAIRKQLHGIDPHTERSEKFGEGIYSKQSSESTYRQMFGLARKELQSGRTVILDATFSTSKQRKEALRTAQETGSRFIMVECLASDATIRRRLAQRAAKKNISDARLQHFEQIKSRFQPIDARKPHRHIQVNTEGAPEETLRFTMAQAYQLIQQS